MNGGGVRVLERGGKRKKKLSMERHISRGVLVWSVGRPGNASPASDDVDEKRNSSSGDEWKQGRRLSTSVLTGRPCPTNVIIRRKKTYTLGERESIGMVHDIYPSNTFLFGPCQRILSANSFGVIFQGIL